VTCETCKHGVFGDKEPAGECRRYPPALSVAGISSSPLQRTPQVNWSQASPRVMRTWQCGEYLPLHVLGGSGTKYN